MSSAAQHLVVAAKESAASVFQRCRSWDTEPEQPSQTQTQGESPTANSGMYVSLESRFGDMNDGPSQCREPSVNRTRRVDTFFFQFVVCAAIVLNVGVMALEVSHIGQLVVMQSTFERIEMAFTLFFALELCFRVVEYGRPFVFFFRVRDRAWNLFDLIITGIGVGNFIAFVRLGSGSSAALSLRIFRCFRILRIFQALKFLSEIDHVIVTAAREVSCFAFMVLLAIFVLGILATHLLRDCDDDLEVKQQFETLGVSMWTLFKMMTMDGWTPIAEAVLEDRPWMVLFFLVFIFLSISSVSIVPAIFLETHMIQRENNAKQIKMKEMQRQQDVQENKLRRFFRLVDEMGTGEGTVSVGALKQAATDGSRLGMNPDDALDARLRLFNEWGAGPEEDSADNLMLDEVDFLKGMFRTEDTHRLQHSVTLLHMEMRTTSRQQQQQMLELAGALQHEMSNLRAEVQCSRSSTCARCAESKEAQALLVQRVHAAEAAANAAQAEAARQREAAAEAYRAKKAAEDALASLNSALASPALGPL